MSRRVQADCPACGDSVVVIPVLDNGISHHERRCGCGRLLFVTVDSHRDGARDATVEVFGKDE